MHSFNKRGSEYITFLIERAVRDGSREARVTGKWEIECAVRIPSDFTLYLEDCHLIMADGVYSNMFVNEHHDTHIGRTREGTDRNISIIGRGSVILDGGNYNGLSESTHSRNGFPPIWKNNLILFTNVDGFKISGLFCQNQRWWALNFVYCSHGYLGHIEFKSSNVGIDENGNKYRGLIRGKYMEVYVKNSDGIDLRVGCHDIVIEDVSGFTEDDTVAVTGLDWILEKYFSVEGLSADIHDITIRRVYSESFCSMVRLLNQGGIKLYNVLVEEVVNTWHNTVNMDTPGGCVRVGDNGLYGTRQGTEAETYNITVRNIYGRGKCALCLACDIGNLVYENISAHSNSITILDEQIGSKRNLK